MDTEHKWFRLIFEYEILFEHSCCDSLNTP